MTGLTVTRQSIDASIELSGSQLSYKLGDSISGSVKNVHIEDMPEVISCGIRLVCQVKTRVSESNSGNGAQNGGSHSSWHHGKKVLIDLGQAVYNGQVSKGMHTWPFSIPVPYQQRLPPTYFVRSEHILGAVRDWLFVEYFLQAEITKLSSPRDPIIALLPIYIRPPSSQHQITTFGLRSWTGSESLRTLRLNPEFGDKRPSFRQHMQSVFHPSSVPHFSFSIAVQYPSVLQLGHRSPMPFGIAALPTRENDGSSEKEVSSLPILTLVKIEACLQTSTRANELQGSSRKVTGNQESYWRDTDLFTWTPKVPRTIPMGTHNGVIDVGSIVTLRLSHRGVSISDQPLVLFDTPLWPSFDSYHVAVSHQLTWRLTIECAGKRLKLEGLAAVTLLGPCEDWYQGAEAATREIAAEAYRKWNEGIATGHGMAISGGPPIWAAGEQAAAVKPGSNYAVRDN